MSDPSRVDVDASPDAVAWTDLSSAPDVQAALWGLYYSIFYGPVSTIEVLPDSVLKAYARVQEASGV